MGILSSLLVVTIVGILIFPHQSVSEKEIITKKYDFHFNVTKSPILASKTFKHVEVTTTSEVVESPTRPFIDGIPLDDKTLDYLFKRTQEENFSYELLLAIYVQESEFGKKKTNYNRNGTVDQGIFHINSGSIKDLAKNAGMVKYDPYNDFDSIDLAIEHLKESREYWRNKDVSEEDLFPLVVASFNMGNYGSSKFIKTNNIENSDYLKNIRKYKEKFERSEE